jgi:hypothetical protein
MYFLHRQDEAALLSMVWQGQSSVAAVGDGSGGGVTADENMPVLIMMFTAKYRHGYGSVMLSAIWQLAW